MKELRQKLYPLSGMISIGELSKKAKTKVVTIRYYESLNLLPDPRPRNSLRSRKYSESYVSRLLFIKKVRELGFSLKEVAEMIKWAEKRKKIPKKRLVKKVYGKMDFIDQKISELRTLKGELYKLIER